MGSEGNRLERKGEELKRRVKGYDETRWEGMGKGCDRAGYGRMRAEKEKI